jgi:hypothetical protein
MGDKELSTGMDRSLPFLLMVNVGNRLPGSPKMDMKRDLLGCLTCPQKGSFPSFTHRGAYNLDLSMKSIAESTVVNLPSSLASRLVGMKIRLEEGSGINVLSPHSSISIRVAVV